MTKQNLIGKTVVEILQRIKWFVALEYSVWLRFLWTSNDGWKALQSIYGLLLCWAFFPIVCEVLSWPLGTRGWVYSYFWWIGGWALNLSMSYYCSSIIFLRRDYMSLPPCFVLVYTLIVFLEVVRLLWRV